MCTRVSFDHFLTTFFLLINISAYDSGSPIIMEGDSPEEDVLVALVSWGEGCADPDFPAVNTRISAVLDFIESSVCEHSMDPPPEFNCPGTPTAAPTGAPTESPTSAPTQEPSNTTTIISPIIFISGLLVAAYLLWLRRRAGVQTHEDTVIEWMPNTKPGIDRRESTETEPLYSPASSKGSTVSGGYHAVESMDV